MKKTALAALAVALAAFVRFIETSAGNIDDAFILLVYAKHFVQHGSFYYNVSDGPIDGFTSPLDLLLKSAAIAIAPRDPIFVCWLVTLLCHIGVALAAFFIAKKIAARHQSGSPLLIATITGLIVATNQGLADGSAFLLETPLTCLLAIVAIGWLLLEPPRKPLPAIGYGLLLAALTLARPEGLVLSVLLLALLIARTKQPIPAIVFGLLMWAYYSWRLLYFHYLAPNTYYAKTSAHRINEIKDGLHYVWQFVLSPGAPGLVWLVLAPLAALSRRLSSGARADYAAVGLLAWAALGTVIWAGGDCYGGGRFLALPLCISLLLIPMLFSTEWRPLARVAGGLLLFVQIAVMIAVPIYLAIAAPNDLKKHWAENVPVRAQSFACDQEVAGKLQALVGGGIVAQTDDQRLKYFADALYVRDLTGLNDRAIAHRSVEGQVLWGKLDLLEAAEQQPAAIVLGHHVYVHSTALASHSLRAAFENAEWSNDYFGYRIAPIYIDALTARYRSASLPACGGWFNFLLRNDLVDRYRAAGILVGPS